MNRALLVLALATSLGANALLALRRQPAPIPAPAPGTPIPATLASSAEISPDTWNRLASDDLPTLMARLQAEQFPSGLLRTIVEAQVRERFADRIRAVAAEIRAKPYWQLRDMDRYADAKAEMALRGIEREVAETMHGLLGPIPDERSEARRRADRRRYGDLSADKIAALERIDVDYRELGNQVSVEASGIFLPEDLARAEFLQKERRADLERLFTPEELAAYDLRQSPGAMRLRSRLSAFDATEAEFRSLFALSRELYEFYNRSTLRPRTDEMEAERRALEEKLQPQIATALGPERYAEYHRSNDPAWRGSHSFVERVNLPSETTPKLFAIQQDITRRAQAVRADVALAPDQRTAQLRGLAQEVERQLGQVLDADNVVRYRSYTGDWIDKLTHPADSAP